MKGKNEFSGLAEVKSDEIIQLPEPALDFLGAGQGNIVSFGLKGKLPCLADCFIDAIQILQQAMKEENRGTGLNSDKDDMEMIR